MGSGGDGWGPFSSDMVGADTNDSHGSSGCAPRLRPGWLFRKDKRSLGGTLLCSVGLNVCSTSSQWDSHKKEPTCLHGCSAGKCPQMGPRVACQQATREIVVAQG